MSIVKGGHFSPATKMMSPLPITTEAKKKDFFASLKGLKNLSGYHYLLMPIILQELAKCIL